jgi:protocatechuate 3,4-dioxygenase beta subunit
MAKNNLREQASRREALGLIGAAGIIGLIGCGSDDQGTVDGITDDRKGGKGDSGSAGGGDAANGGGDAANGGGDATNGGADGGQQAADAAAGDSAVATDAGGTVTDAGSLTCVVRPTQTEGPYFVDEKLERADIRTDPSTGTVSDGALLELSFNVYRVTGAACAPLADAMVDIWQCDSGGVYSDVVDTNGLFNTKGKKFLRGYLKTDANGVVTFKTIYPGWYTGRTVHIHFKIRTSATGGKAFEFTSQLYFDDTLTDKVYTQAPYNAKGARSTRNTQDGIFNQGGSKLLLQVASAGAGYNATFDIGLQIA